MADAKVLEESEASRLGATLVVSGFFEQDVNEPASGCVEILQLQGAQGLVVAGLQGVGDFRRGCCGKAREGGRQRLH